LPEAGKTREELEKAGWKLAATSSGAHLRRVLEMYQELGFDVYLEEVTPEECGGLHHMLCGWWRDYHQNLYQSQGRLNERSRGAKRPGWDGEDDPGWFPGRYSSKQSFN